MARRADAAALPWWALADLLVEREARRTRIRRGVPADALMGLRVDDEEVDRLLGEMTGAGGDVVDAQEAERELDDAYEPHVETARKAFVEALEDDTPFALLARAARLGAEDAEVLALLCAVELEPRRQRLLGYLQDDVTLRHPTLHTLARLFPLPHPGPRAVSPDAPLSRAALVDVADDRPWASNVVRVPAAVLWALIGDASLDPAVPSPAELVESDVEGHADLVFVTGPDRLRRRRLGTAESSAGRFLVTPVPATEDAWRAVVRMATVGGTGVVLETEEALPPEAGRWMERAAHLPWVVSTPAELPIETMPRRAWVERRADDAEVTDEEWAAVFPDEERGGHRLSPSQLELAEAARRGLATDAPRAIRRLAAGRLEHLARRIRPRRTWDDLVLAPDRVAHLHELVSRYRHRHVVHGDWGMPAYPSQGLVALFSGPSGTGKTLAAEIVAADLGVDLFKIDLSAVVSKYIGETEKNLERVFTAAATTNLVMLFDEADALFGKRSEVQDARDRYANLEVSYLLQRLESYDGLVVLTTNFRKNIDEAFLRRVHVAVEFPVPDAHQRRDIWKRSLQPAPLGKIDYRFLADHFEIAGGSIRNAALSAIFVAAEGGTKVTMEAIVHGLKREYQKLGRLVTEHDFGPYYELVREDGGGGGASASSP